MEMKKWLKENYKDCLKSVSFLLHSEHGFGQAPYEEISKEQFDELIKKIKPIEQIEIGSNELDMQDCDKGSCPIK